MSVKYTYRQISDIFSRYNRLYETAIKNSVDKFESQIFMLIKIPFDKSQCSWNI